MQTLQAQHQALQENYQQQAQIMEEKNQQLTHMEIEFKLVTRQHQQREGEIYQLQQQLQSAQETQQVLLQEKAMLMGQFQQLQLVIKQGVKED